MNAIMAPKAVELLSSPLRFPLNNPIATVPLLIAILYYPQKLQALLPPRVQAVVFSAGFIRVLKACLAISTTRLLSNRLSSYALNNWKPAAKFVKSQELVLITGGSSGIGEMMARDFAAKGIEVVTLDVRPPREALPSNIHFYTCDVADSTAIAETAKTIRSSHGHPTVLINNAGIGGAALPILNASESELRKTFEVNTLSHFWMVKEFVPEMVKRNHGHVITIASMSAYVTLAGMIDYACTKNSAVAFHEGLRQELKARYNAPSVRTTLVMPSWIRTPLIVPLLESPNFKDKVTEPEEVSMAIVEQVLSGNSAHLIFPKELNIVSTIRGWPSWLQEKLRDSKADTLAGAETVDRSGWPGRTVSPPK